MSAPAFPFSRRRLLAVAGVTGAAAATGLLRSGVVWATEGPQSYGRYQIINRGTNTALDGMGNTAAGSTASMWAPNSHTNNQWTITAV